MMSVLIFSSSKCEFVVVCFRCLYNVLCSDELHLSLVQSEGSRKLCCRFDVA